MKAKILIFVCLISFCGQIGTVFAENLVLTVSNVVLAGNQSETTSAMIRARVKIGGAVHSAQVTIPAKSLCTNLARDAYIMKVNSGQEKVLNFAAEKIPKPTLHPIDNNPANDIYNWDLTGLSWFDCFLPDLGF